MAASGPTERKPYAPFGPRQLSFARETPHGLRLLFCLVATLLLLVSRPAAAMVLAPMCGGHGETLAAPPITRAAKEYPLAPSGCDRQDDRQDDGRVENSSPNPAPPSAPSIEVVPRLPPVRYRLPPPPRVLVPIESTISGERAGHGRGIERPPR